MISLKAIVLIIEVLSAPYILFAQIDNGTKKNHAMRVNLQYAGNVGLGAIGVGTTLSHKKLYLGGFYGYLPKSVNDVEVHTLSVKFHYNVVLDKHLFKGKQYSLYIGTGINYGITNNTYIKYPDYYPRGYYFTNAIHVSPYLGGEIFLLPKINCLKGLGVYYEVSTIDKYIINAVESKKISVSDILNTCFGLTYVFE